MANSNAYLPFSCPSSDLRPTTDMPREQGLLGAIDSANRNRVSIPTMPRTILRTMPRLQHSLSSTGLSDQESLLAILDEAIGYLDDYDNGESFVQGMSLQRKQ